MKTDKQLAPSPSRGRAGEGAALARAWTSVGLIPVAFLVAFAVGQGLYALLGYKPEDAVVPLWVGLVANVPGILLFLLPCAAAVRYGSRARSEGRPAGVLPAALGAVLGIWMVVLATVTLVSGS